MKNNIENFGYDQDQRRTRNQIGLDLGSAIGSMVTATVLGLRRGVRKSGQELPGGSAAKSANDEVIVEASGWR
ncbi:MAG: hypothetical protein KAX84_01535 [Burkholderiales bacterium]|nr:hypothetical protein [Burkholderiales bacterium]